MQRHTQAHWVPYRFRHYLFSKIPVATVCETNRIRELLPFVAARSQVLTVEVIWRGSIDFIGFLGCIAKALASGTLTVTFEGRSMTYRSVQDLQPAISVVQSSLNQQSGKRVRQYRLSGSKGF